MTSDDLTNLVIIGGGTGAPNLLAALLGTRAFLSGSVVVPVTDTGRSTGVVRTALGIPGPGDLRHALATLVGRDSQWSELLETRLEAPEHEDLDGMAVGNLLLGALTKSCGDIGSATEQLRQMLNVGARVLPVSVEDIHLRATLANGRTVEGELQVREPGKSAIVELRVTGQIGGVWNPTREALESADAIILGPGSLWTSLMGVLAVNGVCEAIKRSRAPVIFICNTTTQPGQTDNFTVSEHVDVIGRALGPPDMVVVNGQRLRPEEESSLITHGLHPLMLSIQERTRLEAQGIKVISADLLARTTTLDLWQKLHTAYHDMERLAEVVASWLQVRGETANQPSPPGTVT